MQSPSLLSSDRRAAARWPATAAHFRLCSETLQLRPQLVDFNAQGLAFETSDGIALPVGALIPLLVRTERLTPVADLVLRVSHVLRQHGKLRVGGTIQNVVAASRSRGRPEEAGDLVTLSTATAARVLLGIPEAITEVIFTSPGHRLALRVLPTPEGGVVGGLYVEVPSVVVDGGIVTGRIHFAVRGASFSADCTLGTDERGRAFLSADSAVVSTSRRRCHRVELRRDEAVVRWSHPLDPTRQLSAAVHDLSLGGVGIVGHIPFPPGERAPMTLEVGGTQFHLEGDVRHLVTEGSRVHMGIRTSFLDARDEVRIAYLCRRDRFPRLLPRSAVPADAVANLLRSSGYLGLRPDGQVSAPFAHTAATEQLSVDTVQQGADGSLMGHISCLRVYRKTWLYHQLATVGRSADLNDCRRALYLDVVDWVSLLAGSDGYSLAYYDRSKAWHKRFFEGFVEWAGSDTLAVVAPLDRFERNAVRHDVEPLPTAATVSRLRPAQASQAAALVARSLPRLTIEAMDLTEPLIAHDLTCASLYRDEGYERGRHAFALHAGEKLVGLALCEIGSRELSLFNLLNVAQVFVEPGIGAAAELALLARVDSFYERRLIADPILASPPGLLGHARAAGFTLAETMGAIAISASGLKQYRNFLVYQFGSRLPKHGSA
jgi:hypothetical protein